MKCPKCNSDNVNIQSKAHKIKGIIIGPCLIGAGIGLMFFGIGAILGAIIGLIIGLIINASLPTTYESIMVCQNCGYVSQPMLKQNISTSAHQLIASPENSNLCIARNDIDKGTIIVIQIIIDQYSPLEIGDNSILHLKLPAGEHVVKYQQINGIGKGKNKGQFTITIAERKQIDLSFTRQGFRVTCN